MTKSLGLIALLFALTSAGTAQASPVVLTLQPAGATSLKVGDTISYELVLDNPDAVLGAFSLDLGFNADALHFVAAPSPGAQFGPFLGDPLLEAVGTAGESSPGVLHMDEVSLLDTASLEALQGGGVLLPSLVLAHLTFQGIGPGLGELAFLPASVQLSDASGNLLAAPTLQQPGAVHVTPEPGSPALAILALAACAAALKARNRPADEAVH